MSEPSKASGYKGTSAKSYKNTGKGNTEEGYTDKMKKNILGAEQKIRNNKDESAYVFDSKGNLVDITKGKGPEVNMARATVPQDAIITHNHPRSIGTTGIRRIGNAFSSDDLNFAVYKNAKEMRAVTPTYTFSVKRPKGGWGDRTQIVKRYNEISNKLINEGNRWLANSSYSIYDTRRTRLEVAHTDRIMKQLAKEFGWKYSKKRG